MAKAENKTKPQEGSVLDFLNAIEHDRRREDALAVYELMNRLSPWEPVLWGSIVGYGQYHYKYDSGREGDMFITGFSPRKTALTLYIVDGFKVHDELMAKLGKFKTGKSCLYVTQLKNIDLAVLEELIVASIAHMREKYGV